jgi:signal transduction histidine kinase/ligand-binding sensor domain-containing protein
MHLRLASYLPHRGRRLWLLSLWIGAVSATAAPPPASPWAVRVWRSDGLPDTTVLGLAQTPDGFLWAATAGHIARFDGNRFEAFSRETITPSLDQPITNLLGGEDGALWLTFAGGGSARVSPRNTQIFAIPSPASTPLSATESSDGALWIGFADGSVGEIKNGSLHRYTTADGLPDGPYAIVAKDAQGRVWFAKGEYVGIFREGRFHVLAQIDRLQKRICGTRDGGMWVCSGLRLFTCSDTGTLKYLGVMRPKNSGVRATIMLEERSGALWIGTSPGGLFRYDGKDFENVPTSDPDITSLFEDAERNLWVGTAGGGLNQVRPRAIAVEGDEAGLPFDTVRLLCEDRSGQLWATTQDRTLVRRTPSAWEMLPDNSARLRGVRVTALGAAPDGALWFGSDTYNLYRLAGDTFTRWQRTDGLTARLVTALTVGRDGQIWIAGADPVSLQSFDGTRFTNHPLPSTAGPIGILCESPTGEIWGAGNSGGLWRIKPEGIEDEGRKLALRLGHISALHFSSDGTLWIADSADGLVRVKSERAAAIGAAHGLYDIQIAQVIEDGDGWLWLGASRGIYKVRRQELDDVADGRAARVQSVRFAPPGIPPLHANFDEASSGLRSRDGRLWLPMGPALAVIDPHKLRDDLAPPHVLIRRVTEDEASIARYDTFGSPSHGISLRRDTQPTVLPAVRRKLEFEFTALSFGAPENIQFRYRLTGFDADWIEAGIQRTVTYGSLPAGDFRFEVKACNSDGIWNEVPAAFAFTVSPVWWQAWWFRVVALAVLTGGIFAIVRYVTVRRLRARLHVLEQQAALDKERSRIARDLHDDLGGRLTQVVLLNELALQDNTVAAPERDRAREVSGAMRQVIKALDETVWALNPRNDTLPDLIDYFGQFSVEFLHAANIRCRVDLPDHPPKLPVPADVRHHLFLVLKEALNNVVRHAQAAEVHLRVSLDHRKLQITIEDNGHGFGVGASDLHADGLRNMRERMVELGGAFDLTSTATGTRIAFQWTLPS